MNPTKFYPTTTIGCCYIRTWGISFFHFVMPKLHRPILKETMPKVEWSNAQKPKQVANWHGQQQPIRKKSDVHGIGPIKRPLAQLKFFHLPRTLSILRLQAYQQLMLQQYGPAVAQSVLQPNHNTNLRLCIWYQCEHNHRSRAQQAVLDTRKVCTFQGTCISQ